MVVATVYQFFFRGVCEESLIPLFLKTSESSPMGRLWRADFLFACPPLYSPPRLCEGRPRPVLTKKLVYITFFLSLNVDFVLCNTKSFSSVSPGSHRYFLEEVNPDGGSIYSVCPLSVSTPPRRPFQSPPPRADSRKWGIVRRSIPIRPLSRRFVTGLALPIQ